MNRPTKFFLAATPIWERGTARHMNRTVSFCADVVQPTEKVCIVLAASCEFVLTVNGRFLAHGPARTAHGFFRVDEYNLTPYLTQPQNRVSVRVAGYYVNSFDTLRQPSFLCAEIRSGDCILAATGKSGFSAYAAEERLQRVQRYSFQRAFAETYRLTPSSFDYERSSDTLQPILPTEAVTSGTMIPREVPYGDLEEIYPQSVIHRGSVGYSEKERYYDHREVKNISDIFFGYRENELEYASHIELGKCDFFAQKNVTEQAERIHLPSDSYADIVFPCNTTGLYELDLDAEDSGELLIVFDEVLIHEEVVPFRPGISNVLTVLFSKGKQHLLCTMPHTMKYARLIAKGATVQLEKLRIHHIAYPASQITARFVGKDPSMQKIYEAAVETFRANSTDLYMDCPSRERAGWLCDGFFTGRVEPILCGNSKVEHAFLENFLLPKSFSDLPHGMLPMCYPADHNDKVFIPNWAMWYALELSEYCACVGSRELADVAQKKMDALLGYFEKFENEYGLLESLQSWVFVEWSRCNDLVQDVSFASNMLYAKMLAELGSLYDNPQLLQKADRIRQTVNQLAMTDSGFFCDNAYRRNGKLVLSGERTEACQYYAFFCDVATPESHPKLWDILVHSFGPDRTQKRLYPEIHPANAFIGNYLRLELLCRYGLHKELYDNIKGYFTYMAERTGTLWEHTATNASCNHGFASHVIYWMHKLGMVQ